MESLLEERAKDKEKIKGLEEEVRSRTGSQGTAEEEPAAAAAEEQTPAAGKEEKPGTQDPHLSAVGPINEGSFAKAKGREDCFANEGDWFAALALRVHLLFLNLQSKTNLVVSHLVPWVLFSPSSVSLSSVLSSSCKVFLTTAFISVRRLISVAIASRSSS